MNDQGKNSQVAAYGQDLKDEWQPLKIDEIIGKRASEKIRFGV